MRVIQIGVIGSMADLKYTLKAKRIAEELGIEIAKRGCVLVFGAEKDSDSLPTAAALAARNYGGLTIGVTYEKGMDIYDSASASVVVATGLVRGGGREMVQSLSCDGVIAIGGGSGTLNEISVAYQAGIPVVLLAGGEGWAEKLQDSYLDERRRYKFEMFRNGSDAIDFLLSLLKLGV